jgi:hypothetical protein
MINWRSSIDVDEDNRHSNQRNADRVVAVMTVPCAGCGELICEIHFANGRRAYDALGVRSVLGEGLYHRHCKGRQP